jgi:hypothetical protein
MFFSSNCTKVNHQAQKLRTISLPTLAQPNQRKRAIATFFSMTMAQILVPYRQPGHRCIHLTSNPGMTSVPQKELLHCNGLHCNATSLLWRFLQHQLQRKRSLKPKTKDHHITKASSAPLMLKGKGDAFWFYQT